MGQGASSSASGVVMVSRREEKERERERERERECCYYYEMPACDFTMTLPDECLAQVMSGLSSTDRKRCSEVCKRWYQVEGSNRQRLTLDASSDLTDAVPAIFARFDHVTRLVLRCDRRIPSIGDDGLQCIGTNCKSLRKLKLKSCRAITDAGVQAFSKCCPGLQKLSVGSCSFGVKGMNAVLANCHALEELSVKRLRGLMEASPTDAIGPGLAGCKGLKRICLKEIHNGHVFVPLVAGSKGLQSLKLFRCSGDWDRLLELITQHVTALSEIHFERLQVSDRGLAAVSRCSNLEILHLVKTPECTNAGLVAVANACKNLRKLHLDGWKTNRIGDEGLMAVGRKCLNLQELVLIGLNPTVASLNLVASNCPGLERLALCGSETIGDPEISCIASKCLSLKKLCIKGCPVSDKGIEALICGCPKLVKVKVKKCRGVTFEGADWLKSNRVALAVSLDSVTNAHVAVPLEAETNVQTLELHAPTSSRTPIAKAKFSFLAGRNLVACAFTRLSRSSR